MSYVQSPTSPTSGQIEDSFGRRKRDGRAASEDVSTDRQMTGRVKKM